MATTYTELLTEIADWLDRSDLTSRIPTFIQFAEAQMNRTLRVQRMIQRSTASIVVNDEYAAVPTNFLEAISFSLSDGTNTYELKPTTMEQIVDWKSDDATTDIPRFFAINGTASGREFQFYPASDGSYTATLIYYGKPTALSGSNATNWILAEAPDAYLYGSLLQAAPYLRDTEAAQIFNAGFQAAVEALKTMDRTIIGPLRTDIHTILRRTAYNINSDV